MISWIITIVVVCIITSVIFCKPYLGIAFVVFSIPFEGVIGLDSISFYPLEVILAILCLICLYKLMVGKGDCFRNTKLMYCCIPFVLCFMLSVVKSIEFSLTLKEIVRWLELFLIYFLTINLINQENKVKIILYSMVSAVALVSTYGFITYYNNVGYASWGHRASSFFGNPNPLAGYVNLMIPVIFGMLMASASLRVRIMLGALAVLSLIVWFLSFSISGWLSLILTMVLVFFLTKANKRVLSFFAILFVIFAITFLSSDNINNFMERERLQSVRSSIKYRVMCYPIGFNMVKDDLILGTGIGNYSLLITKFNKYDDSIIQNHLHSLYFQVLVETGAMGLIAFVFWLVCIVKSLVGSLKVLEKTRNYSLFVGLIGGIIVYLFNNLAEVLTVHGIHLQWGIILGIAVVLTQLREEEECPEMV
jgi:putative inorganic carbon (hco3(-)) transporter